MTQKKLLLELQALSREEKTLKLKAELKPWVEDLRKMLDQIKGMEAEVLLLQEKVEKEEEEAGALSEHINALNGKMAEVKEKLYSTKSGQLKELLGLQQSIYRMEEETEKADARYWENMRQAGELKQKKEKIRAELRELKLSYNEAVGSYKEKVRVLEGKQAEIREKLAAVKKKLNPEMLKLYTDTEKRIPHNPLAVLQGEICSGCRISISSSLMAGIKEGKRFYQCENCGRIIVEVQ